MQESPDAFPVVDKVRGYHLTSTPVWASGKRRSVHMGLTSLFVTLIAVAAAAAAARDAWGDAPGELEAPCGAREGTCNARAVTAPWMEVLQTNLEGKPYWKYQYDVEAQGTMTWSRPATTCATDGSKIEAAAMVAAAARKTGSDREH